MFPTPLDTLFNTKGCEGLAEAIDSVTKELEDDPVTIRKAMAGDEETLMEIGVRMASKMGVDVEDLPKHAEKFTPAFEQSAQIAKDHGLEKLAAAIESAMTSGAGEGPPDDSPSM